jgi:hypothetical protein
MSKLPAAVSPGWLAVAELNMTICTMEPSCKANCPRSVSDVEFQPQPKSTVTTSACAGTDPTRHSPAANSHAKTFPLRAARAFLQCPSFFIVSVAAVDSRRRNHPAASIRPRPARDTGFLSDFRIESTSLSGTLQGEKPF